VDYYRDAVGNAVFIATVQFHSCTNREEKNKKQKIIRSEVEMLPD